MEHIEEQDAEIGDLLGKLRTSILECDDLKAKLADMTRKGEALCQAQGETLMKLAEAEKEHDVLARNFKELERQLRAKLEQANGTAANKETALVAYRAELDEAPATIAQQDETIERLTKELAELSEYTNAADQSGDIADDTIDSMAKQIERLEALVPHDKDCASEWCVVCACSVEEDHPTSSCTGEARKCNCTRHYRITKIMAPVLVEGDDA